LVCFHACLAAVFVALSEALSEATLRVLKVGVGAAVRAAFGAFGLMVCWPSPVGMRTCGVGAAVEGSAVDTPIDRGSREAGASGAPLSSSSADR